MASIHSPFDRSPNAAEHLDLCPPPHPSTKCSCCWAAIDPLPFVIGHRGGEGIPGNNQQSLPHPSNPLQKQKEIKNQTAICISFYLKHHDVIL